jgi:hypothetical protein
MCSRLVHLAETPILTIGNMLFDLLWSSSFVLLGTGSCSWATVLHNPEVVGSWMTMTSQSILMVGVTPSLRVHSHSCLRCEPTQERGDGRWPSHSLLCHWLQFCDEISRKSTTGGGDSMDCAHDGGIGTHSDDVVFLHRLTDWHRQQPLQSPWPRTWCLNLAKI